MTPLVYWSIAWLAGIGLADAAPFPLYGWIAGGVGALAAALGLRRKPLLPLLMGCIFGLALGGARYTLAIPQFDERSLATFNDRGQVTLTGLVSDDPDVRDRYVNYRLDARSLTLEGEGKTETLDVHGTAMVRGPRYPVYAYGDILEVKGGLEMPPVWDAFSYRDYLARKGIHSWLPYANLSRLSSSGGTGWKRLLFSFKARAQSTLARLLPDPEVSLLTGILLGVDTGIPRDLMDDFSQTGTTHVIAISGFNISIIVALLMNSLGRLIRNRWLAAGIALLGVGLYTILVGADAAVVRAALMGSVYVLGTAVQRPGLALNTLAIAALAMTAVNPYILWDVGFQLSVAATLGLILYSQAIEEGTRRVLARWMSTERARQIVSLISEAVLITLAAQVTTLPLILYHFKKLSLVTMLTNALILPVQSPLMLGGGAALLVALVFEPLGRIIAWFSFLFLTWTIRVVEWTAGLPHASVSFGLPAPGLVGVYGLLLGATYVSTLPAERRQSLWVRFRVRLPLKIALGGLALLTTLTWVAVRQFPDGKLHVVFLDVGQGDSIYIESPSGIQILIDGGPEGSVVLSELGRQIPFWDCTLDFVVLTHPDQDHVGGLIPVLERYQARAIVARDLPLENDLYAAWQERLSAEGALRVPGEAATHIDLGDGVTLDVLHPGPDLIEDGQPDVNNNSVVVRLVYRDVSFLLTGDIEEEVEKELIRSDLYLHSTVLKLPHHGSQTSSSQPFLDAVAPQVAVICVGEDNKFNHPAREVLERLEGMLVYRTDEQGTVSITSDGHTLWIDTER